MGQTFDLLIEDFDNDGRLDFLLTAFETNVLINAGSVYVFEIPDDLL